MKKKDKKQVCKKCGTELRDGTFYRKVCVKCNPSYLEKCFNCGTERLNCCC